MEFWRIDAGFSHETFTADVNLKVCVFQNEVIGDVLRQSSFYIQILYVRQAHVSLQRVSVCSRCDVPSVHTIPEDWLSSPGPWIFI